ncbi:MAG: S8 family serine peptidase [Bacteroidales bacterium]|jgi:subtilisin family serine protease|nr:S8 family serine peptidase [Bacteroidales bacterium]
MKTLPVTTLLFFLTLAVCSQIAPEKYFISFTDKNNSPYSTDNPIEFLSQRSIDRRTNQGIAIDMTDLPVNPDYLQGVAETGATILNPSKWLNGVSIFTANPAVLDAIEALPYVAGITKSSNDLPAENDIIESFEKSFFKYESYGQPAGPVLKDGHEIGIYDYGISLNQIGMLNGDAFHELGYRGQGKVIAVLDAGFLNADDLDVFDSLWQNGQILGTRDFVRGGEVLFDEHPHGAMVLSCMGANFPGQLIGTAPKASFWLLRSEDGSSEYIIEEYNWVSAAEFADSVGADVINSSLGYTEFNDPSQNHTYSDMNGDTAPATIGADMAAAKGILVVNSLGNEGSNPWYYLSVPSDGDSVLGIGAVDPSGVYVGFSSHGPSFDGRVKPDVVAQGAVVYIADPYTNGFTYGGGTSFSSPILAGMAACLWQANPSLSNMQIADAIRQSASQYLTPDDFLGHGIPDFIVANNILTVISGPEEASIELGVFPNPFKEEFTLVVNAGSDLKEGMLEITDITGKVIGMKNVSLKNSGQTEIDLLRKAPAGLYFLKMNLNGACSVVKLIKE